MDIRPKNGDTVLGEASATVEESVASNKASDEVEHESGSSEFCCEPSEPSDVCLSVRRLQGSAMKAIASRERLPQPLFWSLFHSEIAEIKRVKERNRAMRKILLGV